MWNIVLYWAEVSCRRNEREPSSMASHKPLVIIPTYNEAENIERLIEEVTHAV